MACHLQWYLDETAETLVHGLTQAIQKRGLPRALLTDNGAAMLATEVRQGLETLGIVHETTWPYSPLRIPAHPDRSFRRIVIARSGDRDRRFRL
ncbi:MAG: integrase catalytic domain-containing protein [Gammaproteobacteria bacterium]